MINTGIPETKVPSHQGREAQTVIPDLDITTLAGAAPYKGLAEAVSVQPI